MDYYRSDTYESARSLGYLLRRVGNLVVSHLEAAFAGNDITFSQWVVLMQLGSNLAATASDLARNTGHDSGALTRLIDGMERRGLIERHRCQDDRRVVKLFLTDRGRVAARTLTPVAVDFYNHTLEGFTKGEVDTLLDLLGRLQTRLCPQGTPVEYPAPRTEDAS